MKEEYTFQEFCDIIASLRGKDGCPWDKAQTHSSMKSCMIHEMTEAIAAINLYEETGDALNLCEELGDLLLQVILQSQIAEEEGLFTVADVVSSISKKMIRRHPHVFLEGYVDERGELIKDWNEIKKIEKSGRSKDALETQEKAEKQASLEVEEFLRKENAVNAGVKL